MSERVELVWYGDDAPKYDHGPQHPLRPARVALTRGLIHAYGILDGTESLERFRRVDDGSKEGYAKLELESVAEGTPGKVDLVPPFDVHAEQGGPTRSVAVILRSERVAGKVLQGSYNREIDTVRRIDGPTNIPYEITA